MAVFEFPCPVCSLTLRARDHSVAGQTIVCADCETSLLVELDGDGQLFARKQQDVSPLSTTPSVKTPVLETTAPVPDPLSPKTQTGVQRRWLLGIAAGCAMMAIFYFMGSPRSSTSTTQTTPPDQANDEQNIEQPVPQPEPADEKNQKVDDEHGLYTELNQLIDHYQQDQGVFPAPPETSLEDPNLRLSWIASLEASLKPDQLPPLWDRPWNHPLNEHFVRRALPHWQNPAIPIKTSPNKYPATHFVGIAGVGKDAASLAKSDPRAGLFGDQRIMSVDDLTAGAANIWMLAGVQKDIGAWAAHGRATVRSWTGGPIIGGPDGFGTGEENSMSILMADGSVRTISADTDPNVLSRLATVQDDIKPRVAKVMAADGNQRPPTPQQPGQQSGNADGRVFEFGPLQAPKPPEAALSDLLALLQNDLKEKQNPQKPLKDVEKQLSQKLLLFDLREPQPLRTVLDQLEEMSGIPIISDPVSLGDAKDRIQEPMSISLIEPTLKEVLENLLQRAKLGYRIVGGRIEITAEPLILIK